MIVSGSNLRREARATAVRRGHKVGRWRAITLTLTRLTCVRCAMSVDVDIQPPANGIHIGGEAVALNCT